MWRWIPWRCQPEVWVYVLRPGCFFLKRNAQGSFLFKRNALCIVNPSHPPFGNAFGCFLPVWKRPQSTHRSRPIYISGCPKIWRVLVLKKTFGHPQCDLYTFETNSFIYILYIYITFYSMRNFFLGIMFSHLCFVTHEFIYEFHD